jgi:hypothetical protein
MLFYLIFLIPFNGLCKELDTLPRYFHLEYRLGDCAESLDFMRFHLQQSKTYSKAKSKSKHAVKYKVSSSLRFDHNNKGISDLHRFYIDLECLKSMKLDSVLSLLFAKKIARKLTKKIKGMSPQDSINLSFIINNSDGFNLTIVNKNITVASWEPFSYNNKIRPNINGLKFTFEDSLPSKYFLHNRTLNCSESYEFMKNCIDESTKTFKNHTPNDIFERVRVSAEIANERVSSRGQAFFNSFDYAEFYIDINCLKNEPIEKVLTLFLTQESVIQVLEKVERLKHTEYVLHLSIDIKYIAGFGIRIEQGKISSMSWPTGWSMY